MTDRTRRTSAGTAPVTQTTGAETTLRGLAADITRTARALRFTTERDLQDALADLLGSHGYTAAREQPLGPAERPDFLVDGQIAVEVKVKGTTEHLERQVRRYLAHPEVTGVLVVTNRARHRNLPAEVDGKPILVVWIASAF